MILYVPLCSDNCIFKTEFDLVFTDNNDIAATVMSMKEDINRIMSSKRAKLADSVEEREETLGLLRRHGPLEVRTVEEMKLAMVMTTVYERYTQMQ